MKTIKLTIFSSSKMREARFWPEMKFEPTKAFPNWRRGRDSNPGWSCPHNGFRDRPIQPLWHLSIKRQLSVNSDQLLV